MENNDKDLLTVNDLRKYMLETHGQSLTVKWIRHKLEEKYGERLVICQKRGMDDIIILSGTASSLLYEFRQEQCSDDVSKEKDRIIKLAADLIAQDIEVIESDPSTYFSVDDIDIEKQLRMMPPSLKNLIYH